MTTKRTAVGMTDSSDASSEEDFLFPDTNPGADEFDGPRPKRRKTGRDNKESAALGIFGSESEDDRPGQQWKSKSLRGKGVGFVSSKAADSKNGDDGDDDDDDDEEADEMSGVETTGLGLGWNSQANKPASTQGGASSGLGFTPSSANQNAYTSSSQTQTMRPRTPPPVSRPSNFGGKKGGANNSFAAKMMAKMGYVEGQGLGTTGQGMLNPIETKLRPQGAGLGAVKEKTQQARDEAKRQAARQGVVLEDSEEEERKKRKKARERQKLQRAGGQSTPALRKVKYRTVADIEAATEGLEVPNVLKSLIDATGKEQKLLTSTSGLMASSSETVEAESTKIARRAKRDLEAFADAWNVESEKKKYLNTREFQLVREIEAANKEVERTRAVLKSLEGLDLEGNGSLDAQWETAIQVLDGLQRDHVDDLDELNLTEAAICALEPLFRRKMDEWEPLIDPTELVSTIKQLQPILRPQKPPSHRKSTTLYESLVITLWLPKVRSALTNWNVYDPQSAIILLETWAPLLPEHVYAQILSQIILPVLHTGIKSWKPRARKSASHPAPHTWLFPWLPILPEESLDMESTTSLPVALKYRLRSILRSWDLTSPPPYGISDLTPVLPTISSVLTHSLLPRLSLHFDDALEIDPSAQDMAPLNSLMQYTPLLSISTITTVLTRIFFPKWLSTLHLWLTSDPDYSELAEWYEWWKGQFPSDMSLSVQFRKEWMQGLVMMNHALDLGDKVHKLPAPVIEVVPLSTTEHLLPQQPVPQPSAPLAATPLEPLSFKDTVDDFCQSANLLFLPLRSAHPTTGLPLWRITASPSGRGGLVVYLKGDVVWAKQGKGKDEEGWRPMGLDEKLVVLAEG